MNGTYSYDNRIIWIDMLKGIAMLAVMIGHLMPNTYIGDFVYSFSVPLFIFASGYLFQRYDSFKVFLKHKFKSLIIPYLMFGLPFPIAIAYYNVATSGGSFNGNVSLADYFSALLQELINYILQIHYNVIWYLAMIFLANVIMYFILIIRRRWIQIAIVLMLLILGSIYFALGGKPLIWNIDTVLMSLPFFYVGHLLAANGTCIAEISELTRSKALLLFFAFLIGNVIFNQLTIYVSGECLDMNSCEYGFVPLTYVSAFLGIFAFLILSVHFKTMFMEFLGRHSLIYYVIHVAIIHGINFTIFPLLNIRTLVDVVGSGNYNLMEYPLMIGLMMIYLVLIVFITWLIILLFSKTPLKRYF